MPSSDDAPPPRHLGDHPHGAYWSAERPVTTDEDEPPDHTVSGPLIRFMWDYGVRIPLWDAEGLLPEEPEWLRVTLGLSDPLIEDLRGWGLDMDALDAAPGRRTTEAYDALDRRAAALVEQLRHELSGRYRVTYHPW